jgi:hypothetical protein
MIYFVVPKLVVQDTWGGNHIASQKGIGLGKLKIGQSYEFSANSRIVPADLIKNIDKLPYYIGTNDIKNQKLQNPV